MGRNLNYPDLLIHFIQTKKTSAGFPAEALQMVLFNKLQADPLRWIFSSKS
jgi:hypothetical protein